MCHLEGWSASEGRRRPLTRPERGGIRAVFGVGVAVLVTAVRTFSEEIRPGGGLFPY